MFYLVFQLEELPDLTLAKYKSMGGSGVNSVLEAQTMFLRQLHRFGLEMHVSFHLLYRYRTDASVPNGQHLQILFYASAENIDALRRVRYFIRKSSLCSYYNFTLLRATKDYDCDGETIWLDGEAFPCISGLSEQALERMFIQADKQGWLSCAVDLVSGEICKIQDPSLSLDCNGLPQVSAAYQHAARLTKKTFSLTHYDGTTLQELYSTVEWEANDSGRMINLVHMLEGYAEDASVRIDLFPVDHTDLIRHTLPYMVVKDMSVQAGYGSNHNEEEVLRSWDALFKELNASPQFQANIAAFANSQEIAVMLVDSIGAEANQAGSYELQAITAPTENGFTPFSMDDHPWKVSLSQAEYVEPLLNLFLLNEISPMFRFPALYPGEHIECRKETDPSFPAQAGQNNAQPTDLMLGTSELEYNVYFPLKLFKKHAFIAGVPGSGKTNTMLYLVTQLWKKFHVPFLVLEPAKQEYRALANIDGMDELYIFSPGADTRFPLHINPFEFPVGLTLAEHINNLKAVFEGAFELPPPSPHFIDTCIEQVYVNTGWNINQRNNGKMPYPTMQDLYASLEIAVKESHYQGETLGNLQSVLEVRVGSLLKREIGNVYNVAKSTFPPEEWLDHPVVIELEALGEGPANFMSLLISTLIREELKLRRFRNASGRSVEHIIFYEEAHNLIGPDANGNQGNKVDPKVSATKYLVKMLAEVRALNEGIVIADQLPTVMAAEVLKNTGLKIGHRITSEDDRVALGSTMSADAEQLEAQALFMPGMALVSYEGLQKPFQMQLGRWQTEQSLYDSRTDTALAVERADNPAYLHQIERSMDLLTGKFRRELEAFVSDFDLDCSIFERYTDRILEQEKQIYYISLANGSEGYKALSIIQAGQRREEKIHEQYLDKIKKHLNKATTFYCNYMAIAPNYGCFETQFARKVATLYLQFLSRPMNLPFHAKTDRLWEIIYREVKMPVGQIHDGLKTAQDNDADRLSRYFKRPSETEANPELEQLLECMRLENSLYPKLLFSTVVTQYCSAADKLRISMAPAIPAGKQDEARTEYVKTMADVFLLTCHLLDTLLPILTDIQEYRSDAIKQIDRTIHPIILNCSLIYRAIGRYVPASKADEVYRGAERINAFFIREGKLSLSQKALSEWKVMQQRLDVALGKRR